MVIYFFLSSSTVYPAVEIQKALHHLDSPKWKLLSCSFQSMEFSRPESWSGYPFPSSGDLPNPGIESRSPTLQEDSSPAEPQGKPKHPGMGSLSFLQQIFPTQEWTGVSCIALQADSLPTELSRKPSETVVLHILSDFLTFYDRRATSAEVYLSWAKVEDLSYVTCSN